ncbi:hypothetical protein RAS1_26150 [Phycisphaerae bacterium RAS1]|nr:hypothetical protein RAS1_26150 [Phycisphaerae bacterium RAS1]
MNRALRSATFALALLLAATTARATWSIIVVDTESKEVCIASATCLMGFNLEIYLPVLRVDVGAGAAQSFVDTTGQNRLRIWNGLIAGTPPADILLELEANDPGHQTRQYGMVDVLGRTLTFTGSGAGAYANGVTGQVGRLAYAIQGNVITGPPVIIEIERVIREYPGDIPTKMMYAMEIGFKTGGDGRCSCSQNAPTFCGSPPNRTWRKASHTAFLIDARRGDADGVCNTEAGCTSGAYFINLNYITSTFAQRDPVLQMADGFAAMRFDALGKFDQAASLVTITPPEIPADGTATATLRVELRDWMLGPAQDVVSLIIEHDPRGSTGSSAIGTPQMVGDGVWEAPLTAGTTTGLDVLAVRVNNGASERYVIPSGKLTLTPPRLVAPAGNRATVRRPSLAPASR